MKIKVINQTLYGRHTQVLQVSISSTTTSEQQTARKLSNKIVWQNIVYCDTLQPLLILLTVHLIDIQI